MKRHWFRPHRWQTIIREPGGRRFTQRCIRCGNYRTVKVSDHERVKEMT